VENGESAILVDTGSALGYDLVLNECKKYNLKLIVLTHVHFDHAENAAKLAREFNVPVAFHKADEELFENYDAQPLKSYGVVGRVVLGLSLKVLRETKIEKPENIVYVKDGDVLSSYGIAAKIIELPGHTDGSIGVDVEGQSLLVGDALDNWISPATGHLYSDIDKIKGSAQKIRALGERMLYYGHGKPTTNRFK
jgi:glyoxylase-like metal-dependent hydrolase (beta-lactamase superfamily II)